MDKPHLNNSFLPPFEFINNFQGAHSTSKAFLHDMSEPHPTPPAEEYPHIILIFKCLKEEVKREKTKLYIDNVGTSDGKINDKSRSLNDHLGDHLKGKVRNRRKKKMVGCVSKRCRMMLMVVIEMTVMGVVGGEADTSVSLVLCNGGGYTKGDPFGTSLAYVIADLEAKTPKREGHNYYNISPFPNSFAYGFASCTHNLSATDCSACLTAAKTTLFGACNFRIGARTTLHDCQIRYEQYPFDD